MKRDSRQGAAATQRRPYRRRQYLINPAVQWKYAITSTMAVFMLSSLIGSVLYGLLHHQARMRAMEPTIYTGEVTWVILLFGLGFAAVTAAGVGVWSIIVTHRICGPLHVVQRYLGEMSHGHLPTPRPLRRKDEFKDFYATFCNTVESLKVRKQVELGELTETLAVAKSAIDADDKTGKDSLRSVVRRMESLCAAAAEALGQEADKTATASVTESAAPVAALVVTT